MAITNTIKPTTSFSNTDRVVQYETFDTLTTTFDTETRTFDQMGTTWTNTSIIASDWFFSNRRFPFTESSPFTTGGITNQSKP